MTGPRPGTDARPSPRTLVVWNPAAGDGRDAPKRRSEITAALAGRGVRAEVFESRSEEDSARRVERALADGVERIVAAGGDGTVRSVAFQLLDRAAALGILPLGTAMNVARSLEIPLDLEGAAAVLATGTARPVDVAEARGRPFLEVATVGLAADLLADATRVSEGRLRSALDLLARAARYRRTRLWLELDGREIRHRGVSVAIANGAYTGRALQAAPQARLDDGLLEVVCYLGYGPVEVLRELVRVTLGLGRGAIVATYRAAHVRVRSHHPLPVRADSQDLGATPVELTVRRGALRIIQPR